MNIYLADIFGVDEKTLAEYGAFNVSLLNDLPLFIDPFLLFNSTEKKYQDLHAGILKYLRFLRDRAVAGQINPGLLKSWFMFPEVKQTWLGYSLVGNRGSGLGKDFARALNDSLHTIFSNFGSETVSRSSHLEKLTLIKSGVGRDNISDFTTHLILDYLLSYTQEFARVHLRPEQRQVFGIRKVRFNYDTHSWEAGRFELPCYLGDYVILTPKDILVRADTWINRSDMLSGISEIVEAVDNEQLRAQLNEYLAMALRDKSTKKDKEEAASGLVSLFPQVVDYYIKVKEDEGDGAVDVSQRDVAEVEDIFIHNVENFTEILHARSQFYSTGYTTYADARARVMYLKDVIENKGGHHLFFDAQGKPIRRESDVQILFRFTWFATLADVSREVNDGRGPVDFKVSMGRWDKSLVEFKLASNTQLKRNLENQVPIYQAASDARRGMKVIVYFEDKELDRVQAILKELGLHDNRDVIFIDARASNKPSGSKA